MDNIEASVADAFEGDLNLTVSPFADLDRMADYHRRATVSYAKRAANARKAGAGSIREMEEERRRLKLRFDADLERIAAEIAGIKSATAEEVAVAEKLAAVSRTALEALL